MKFVPTRAPRPVFIASVVLALWASISGSPAVQAPRLGAAEKAAAVRADRASLGLSFDTGWSHDENSGDGYAYFRSKIRMDCAHTRVGNRQSKRRRRSRRDRNARYGTTLRPSIDTAASALLRYGGPANADARTLHVVCDMPLTLTFWVADSAELDVRYGTFVDKRTHRRFAGSAFARLSGFVPRDGWSATCERCAVRRAITLAVGNGKPTRPGSYAGIEDVPATSGASARRVPSSAWTRAG